MAGSSSYSAFSSKLMASRQIKRSRIEREQFRSVDGSAGANLRGFRREECLSRRGLVSAMEFVDVDGDDAVHVLHHGDEFAECHRLTERARLKRERVLQGLLDGGQHLALLIAGVDVDGGIERERDVAIRLDRDRDDRVAAVLHRRHESRTERGSDRCTVDAGDGHEHLPGVACPCPRRQGFGDAGEGTREILIVLQ